MVNAVSYIRVKAFVVVMTLCSFVLFQPTSGLAQQVVEKPYIAVLDLDLSPGVNEIFRTPLSDRVRSVLYDTNAFDIIDRNNMHRIMAEQRFQLEDCTTEECRVRVGELLGVEKIVTGSITLVEQLYSISLQLTNVETGRIERMISEACPCDFRGLLAIVGNMGQQLGGGVDVTKLPEAPREAPSDFVSKTLQAIDEELTEKERHQRMTEQERWRAYNIEKRSCVKSVLWSILPGGGMFYNRKYFWGVLYGLGKLGSTNLIWQFMDITYNEETGRDERNWTNGIIAFIGAYTAISIAEAVHSCHYVKKYNRPLQEKYRLIATVGSEGDILLGMHYRF